MYGKLNNGNSLDGILLKSLVDELLQQGLSAWVSYDSGHDRDEMDTHGKRSDSLSTNRQDLLDSLGECDEEHLFVGKDGKELGWVFLVYGNGPGELIADYSMGVSDFIKHTNALAAQQEKEQA